MKNEKIREIDVDKLDLDKMGEKVSQMPGLLEYAHTVGGVSIKPEDRGKIKGRAVAAMHDQTDRQMQQILKQMQTLADQARSLKARVLISERIYQAQINFEPIIGKIYHLYERNDGSDTLSLVSPEEWGTSMPFHMHLATVKLLSDHTWEIIKENDS